MPVRSKVNVTNANALTQDILVNILRRFPPKAIAQKATIDKKFSEAVKNNGLWAEKFKRHFPDHYKNIAVKTDINWYVEFQKVHKNEYEGLPESRKKLLLIIKESDMESLAKEYLSFDILENTKDRHGHSLLNWAQKIGDQELLNYLFDRNAYNPDSDEDKVYIADDKSKFFSKTLLYRAIALQQDYKKILYLISEGRWPNNTESLKPQIKRELLYKRFGHYTLLDLAAGAGHLPLVQYLLDQRIDDLHELAFGMAISAGHAGVITAFFEKRVDMNFDGDAIHPVHYAAGAGQLNVVHTLIALDPELLNKKDRHGRTPLMWAVQKGHLQTVRYLVQQKNIQLNATIENFENYQSGRTVLHLVRPSKDCREIVTTIIEAGADTTIVNSQGLSPLHQAATEANLDVVKAFIETDSNLLLNQEGKRGWKKLMMAIDNLLKRDDIDKTVLHVVVKKGWIDIIKKLIKNKPELLNQTNGKGFTPLMYAVKVANSSGNSFVMQFLLSQDNIDLSAVVTKGKDRGKTVLQLADTPHVVNILLEHYVKRGLPIDKRKLNDKARATTELFEYIKERRKGSEYKYYFPFFYFKYGLGFSQKEKLAAAETLRLVILGVKDVTTLEKYRKELNNGKLKTVYDNLKPYFFSTNKYNRMEELISPLKR